MTLPEKILIPLPDCTDSKVISREIGYVELHEQFFVYRAKFTAMEPQANAENETNESLWEEAQNDHTIVAKRERISNAELIITKDKKWKILLSVMGAGSDVFWYYTKESMARAAFAKILIYIFGHDYPHNPQPGQTGQEGTAR